MMLSRLSYLVLLLTTFLCSCTADYACVCSKAHDSPIHSNPDTSSKVIDYLYGYDCRALYSGPVSLSMNWRAILINHQIGYVMVTPQLSTENCQGNLPTEDKLTTLINILSTPTHSPTLQASTRTPHPSSSTTTGTTVSTGYTCPANVKHAAARNHGHTAAFGTTCYELVPFHYSWQYAESNCHHKGGHLVHIQNSAEEANLMSFLNAFNYNHHIWIGLNDIHRETHFEWSSGDSVTFTHWHPGYGLNHLLHQRQDCVILDPSTPPTGTSLQSYGLWDDVDCHHDNAWVCQYDAVPTLTNQMATSALTNHHHYHHVTDAVDNLVNNFWNLIGKK